MGFGDSPAGEAPAGFDQPETTEERISARPAALQFDGETLDFVKTSGGQFAPAHPVDAKMFNALRIAGGTIRSAPELGQGISSLEYIDPLTIDDFVRDQVQLATADMIAAGEVTVHGAQLDTSVRGRLMLQVDYTNLRLGKRQTVPIAVSHDD